MPFGDVPQKAATSAAASGPFISASKTPSFVPTMIARARMKAMCVSISVTGGIPSASPIRSSGLSAPPSASWPCMLP